MTNFEKDAIVVELLSDNFEMVETDDAKVVDTTQLSSKEMAKLKLIIEANE
jgi:hypothetical protein